MEPINGIQRQPLFMKRDLLQSPQTNPMQAEQQAALNPFAAMQAGPAFSAQMSQGSDASKKIGKLNPFGQLAPEVATIDKANRLNFFA